MPPHLQIPHPSVSHPTSPIPVSPSYRCPHHPSIPTLVSPTPLSPLSVTPSQCPHHPAIPIISPSPISVSPSWCPHMAWATLPWHCSVSAVLGARGGELGVLVGVIWGLMGGDGAPRSSLGCIGFGGLSIQAGHWGGVSVPLSERSSAIGTMGRGCGGVSPCRSLSSFPCRRRSPSG